VSTVLRFAALIAFIVGAILTIVQDPADPLDLFLALFVGLACWVGSTFLSDRP
jgi:hypothetical protein